MRSFIITCACSRAYLTNSNVVVELTMHDLNNREIQELLLEDLTKTQYTRDDEGPYFCINVDQQKYDKLYSCSNEFTNHLFCTLCYHLFFFWLLFFPNFLFLWFLFFFVFFLLWLFFSSRFTRLILTVRGRYITRISK